MISKRPSSHFTSSDSSSRSSSRYSPSAGGWDADDEDAMSTGEDHSIPLSTTSSSSSTTRPLSVAIPTASGPYCPRRPNLKEILANTSPPPWTLAAFMAYLSSNLCLENLEFTMDAGRYKKHYAKMLSKAGDSGKPSAKDSEYVRLLWVRLIDAYIAPNGSREVNLPSNVRDPILNAATTPLPPVPETLDIAVNKTYELMEESVLVPFLNSYNQGTAGEQTTSSSMPDRPSSMSAQTYEEHNSMFTKRRKARDSPPPHTSVDPQTYSYPVAAGMNRISAPLTLSSSMNKSRPQTKAHTSGSLSTSMSNTSDANLSMLNWGGPGMTDDSGSTGSPTNEGPMTPPMSPPVNELGGHAFSSPKHGRDSGVWKKLGRLSGMKVGKKKSTSGDSIEE